MAEPKPFFFSCFVTGTDTEIGKTLVSSALLHSLAAAGRRAAGMKPVSAGAQWLDGAWRNEDVESLCKAGNLALPASLIAPYVFRDPIAPHIAAEREGVTIDVDHILGCYRRMASRAQAVVVEGVGGFCVPLSPHAGTADMAVRLGLPVVLVVGLRLGCLSHALLTSEVIVSRGLTLAGWVANTVDGEMPFLDENVQALRERLPAPLLGVVPRMSAPDARTAASHLDFTLLPGWEPAQGPGPAQPAEISLNPPSNFRSPK